MKYFSLLFLAFLITQFNSLAQAPDTMWTKTFGGSVEDEVNVIIQTNDEGFVFGGMVNDSSYVVKLNQSGNIIWTNISTFFAQHDGERVMPNLHELSSERYVMGFVGLTGLQGGIKLIYSNGDSVAHFAVGIGSLCGPRRTQICKSYDNNYILVSIRVTVTVNGDIQKVDTLGNELWYKWYFPIEHLIQTKDSAFAFIGRNYGSLMPLILARTDIYGDTVWTQEYQDTTTSSLSGVCLEQVGDKGYIILANDDNQNVRLFKTNEWGELIWEKTYGQSGIYSSKFLTNTPDGGYIIIGSTESIGAGGSDAWVLKIDSLGNIKWTKTIGGTGNDYGKYIQTTSDGGYIIAADTWSYGQGEQDIWIIKLEPDPTVNIDNEIDIIKNFKLSYNYPNPFNPSTNIKYSVPQTSQVQIKVYDVLGNEITTLVNEEKSSGTYELTWNAAEFPSGVYFYQLKAGAFTDTKKMILMK